MTHTTTLPLPVVSPEVAAFAAEHGVERYLPDLVSLVRRIFPDSRIDIVVADDPELSYNRQLVFEVDGNGRNADERVELQQRWREESFRHCPATHLHVFSLIQL